MILKRVEVTVGVGVPVRKTGARRVVAADDRPDQGAYSAEDDRRSSRCWNVVAWRTGIIRTRAGHPDADE